METLREKVPIGRPLGGDGLWENQRDLPAGTNVLFGLTDLKKRKDQSDGMLEGWRIKPIFHYSTIPAGAKP